MNAIITAMMDSVAAAFGLGKEEAAGLKKAPVPRLIAALPFIAGCPEAERIAAIHLAAYLLSVKTDIFTANMRDNRDVFARLEAISHFPGGKAEIIKKGMSLLALCMLANYNKDRERDKDSEKYNPLNRGVFDFPEEKNKLMETIHSVDAPEIDAIFTVEEALRGWWEM